MPVFRRNQLFLGNTLFCWEKEVLNAGDYSSFHLQAQWEGLTSLQKVWRKGESRCAL